MNVIPVTDKDREAAKRFVCDYNVRDIFHAREAPIEELTDMLAAARAEGYAAGTEDAAKKIDSVAVLARLGVASSTTDFTKREMYGVVAVAMEESAAAIRARGEAADATLSPRKRGSK